MPRLQLSSDDNTLSDIAQPPIGGGGADGAQGIDLSELRKLAKAKKKEMEAARASAAPGDGAATASAAGAAASAEEADAKAGLQGGAPESKEIPARGRQAETQHVRPSYIHKGVPKCLQKGSLFRFAVFSWGFDVDVKQVAKLALKEEWANQYGPTGLLTNYLVFSFEYMYTTQSEKCIKFSHDEAKSWAAYDTRLLSSFETGLKPIYALFQKNSNKHYPQDYFFKGWCSGWGAVQSRTMDHENHQSLYGSIPPEPFSTEVSTNPQPAWWKDFKEYLPFYHNADHILRDEKNAERLREICTLPGEAPPSDEDIASKFEAALTYAERYAKLNPRRVLPQLYLAGGLGSGKGFSRQLLLPLHIMSKPMADAALAVNLVPDPDKKDEDGKTDWMYVGATLLTLDMALQNARVVNSIEVPWLCHAGQQLYEMQQAIDNLINENEDLRVAVQNTLQ